MKKTAWKTLILSIGCMVLMFAVWGIPVQAGTVTKLSSGLFKNKTFYQDITCDGKKDKIQIRFQFQEENDFLKSCKVYVNGRAALTIKPPSYECCYVNVNYIQMSSSQKFLQIYAVGQNDWIISNALYRYDSAAKKLKSVLELPCGRFRPNDVTSASDKQIKVKCWMQPQETGRIYWYLTYVYRNGQFKLKSSLASVKSYLGRYEYDSDGYSKYFRKSKFVAANKRTFYKNTNLKVKSFTAYRGDVLTLKRIKVTDKSIYLEFQKGSKTGWQRIGRRDVYDYSVPNWDDVGKTGWFYGVFNRLAG